MKYGVLYRKTTKNIGDKEYICRMDREYHSKIVTVAVKLRRLLLKLLGKKP